MFPTLSTWTTHFIEARTTALHVQLVTQLYLHRLHIFNKIEVSRLDSTLSLFIIISSYIQTLSWCQIVVRSSRNWEHLTVIEHSISRGFEIFRLLLRPFATAYWRCKKRVYFFMDLKGTWKADIDRPAQQS